MTVEEKVVKLGEVLKEYEPHLKVWENTHVYEHEGFVYIMFTNPKSKNKFSMLTKEIPLEHIDKVIEMYKSKVRKYGSTPD